MTLADLGWNDALATAFAPYAADGLLPARVTLQLKGFWEVTQPDEARLADCTGNFLNETSAISDMPAVGDWVAILPLPGDPTRAQIHAVLPRRTKFSRKAAGVQDIEQIVAANIDTVFLVSSLDGNFNLRRIERYLSAARASGAQPVVVLNKSDLTPAEVADRRAEVEVIARGIPVVVTSAVKRGGLKPLQPWLVPHTTVAFLGSSGVGKSTLINEIVGDDVLFTQEVRNIDGKGRHTTTRRELILSPDGVLIIDTPGMRELQPWQADESVEDIFADLKQLTLRCKFTNCSHTTEPGCVIVPALADGTLERARWNSYQRLLREMAFEVRRTDRRASQKGKSEWKKQTKLMRQRVEEKRGED